MNDRRAPFLYVAMVAALAAAALSPLTTVIREASAQATRPIKVVVPYPPGGAIDVLARVVAEQLGKLGGPAVVIENRPGAGTEIGIDLVARAAPDGDTLLMGSDGMLVLPYMRKVSFDLTRDLVPICELADVPTVIVVNKASPLHTLDDLVRAARAKPGVLTYGSAPGSVLNVGFEMFAHAAKFKMTFVPFGGTPPAVNALLGGNIDVAMVDYPAAAGQIKAGTLRALATGASRRIADMPDVPTVAESGYKGYELDLWYGPFAPAKTPPQTIATLISWFTRVMQSPDIKPRLAALQFSPALSCGADFAAFLHERSAAFGEAIREANIQPK